jgi:O-acetyl-ADP-ribose deacetylase (regulator of RNase III)
LIPISSSIPNGFQIFTADTLEDLGDLLLDFADTYDGDAQVRLNFCSPGKHPFTIPEAFQLTVEVMNKQLPPDVKIFCEVASSQIALQLARYLPGGDHAPREARIGNINVRILQGDITRIKVDAIVNASNTLLRLGSGVSGAIRRAASNPSGLQAALAAQAPISPGDVAVTDAFGLPLTRTIVHAATASGDMDVIQKAAKNILAACSRWHIQSVAIPAIGSGTGGLPLENCASILYEAIATHQKDNKIFPANIIFALNSETAFLIFCEIFNAGAKGGTMHINP